MSPPHKTRVLLAVMNEEIALRDQMPELVALQASGEFELHFLLGPSEDGTEELLHLLDCQIHHDPPDGVGANLQQVLKSLSDAGCDTVVLAQPDGNCNLREIPRLLHIYKSGQYKLLIASRYLNGMQSVDDTPLSRLGNRFFARLFTQISGTKVTDPLVGFRICDMPTLKREGLLERQSLERIESFVRGSLSIEPLITYRFVLSGAKFTEVSIPEGPRAGGKTKRATFRWGLGYLLQMVNEWYRYSLYGSHEKRGARRDHRT